MPIVKMPDGTRVRFPDDMPRDQIRDLIASKFPEAASKPTSNNPSYFEGLAVPGTFEPTPNPTRYQSMIPGGDAANEFAMSFGENIPVIGPLVTGASDAVGSRIASMITGRPADELTAEAQERRARDAAENQVANAAGTVAGTVGPLMSVGTTQIGGQALGLAGPWWQRMAAGGVSGAGIAGGDALARGEGIGDAAGQGAIGLGAGAVLPLAERALSPIARMIMGKSIPAPVQSVSRNLEREGIDPATLRTMIADTGPDAVLADMGPNLTRQAGAIASLPGEGQSVLRNALLRRQQGTNARIQSDVYAALGPAPVPSAVSQEIRAGQQALGPEYQRVLAGAGPVDTSSLAQSLDAIAMRERGPAQSAAAKIRTWLNESGSQGALSTDPATLLATRNAIDGLFAGEANPKVIAVLTNARQQIDDLLSQAAPGIKEVDARFADLGRQSEALQTGQQVLDSGRTAPRPAEVEAMIASGANPEGLLIGPSGAAFRLTQGARAEIDRIIGTTANNLTALKSALKGDGSWNRDRLVTLFGHQKADRLLNILERETTYARTANTVLGNSETAARTAAQKEAAPNQFGSGSISLADILLRVPQMAANAAARTRSESVNRKIAEMLAGRPTPELVDQLIAARHMNRGLIGSSAVPLLTNQ